MLKITAAVPTYNSEHFISRCLDSLVQQTMPNNEYEIICVDDCSQDGTVALLKKYSEQYSNITVIEREENSGGQENQETKPYARPAVNTFFLLIPMII
ncbi:glycosyltransferase [Bacillus inaquosorum]|nr:glycosyltransferase [Bacillus inaquosorum]